MLKVENLNVEFSVPDGSVQALRDVSVSLNKGETLGIAGESGSGKSTLALAIVRYLDSNGHISNGTIQFEGRELLNASEKELRSIRGGEIAHVAQNPSQALNPSMTIGEQINESIRLHQNLDSPDEARERTIEVLDQVNIPDPAEMSERYPHELSGGQQQRALLAIGLSCNPDLLILDEPTTGLDVTTQAKFLDLIQELKSEYNTAILLITHNLGVISEIADRVNILYAGEMVEKGPVDQVFSDPANPYTQALLATTPELGIEKELRPIPGRIPDLDDIPTGCIFADRCDYVTDECKTSSIQMETISESGEHESRCLHWEKAMSDPIEAGETASRSHSPGEEILTTNELKKYYDESGFIQNRFFDHQPVQAVSDVSLSIRESETVGLVGESGCGKSTLGRTLLKLHDPTDGSIEFRHDELSGLEKEQLQQFRAECQIIFQDPEASLNPNKTIEEILERPLKLFTDNSSEERQQQIIQLLEQVDLGGEILSKQPHELSGGQQQRVAIARAFAANPSLIVLDEPVASLDVSVQASILNLLNELRDEYGTSYLLVSHDLSVIESICDRVAVMYLGKIIETGITSAIFNPPYHPYTRSLLKSIPSLDPTEDVARIRLDGDVPSARDPPNGCSFHTRCPKKIGEICETEEPQLEAVANDESSHCIGCHLDQEQMESPLDLVAEESE